jgi:hypothetical protein
MSKAFHTWNETIGALWSPLMEPNGPPSNEEVFARLNRMKLFRRFRALCEAIGFKPPDGAGQAKAAAYWLCLLEQPEDFHDKLWRLFADYIGGMQQRWAATERLLSATETVLTKTTPLLAEGFNRKNALIARQAEALARRMRSRRRKRGGGTIRPLTSKQAEALHMLALCNGNYAEAARRIRIDRKSFEERCEAAYGKLGRKGMKRHEIEINKALVTKLPRDERGQEVVVADDDGPAALEGRKPRKATRSRRG